MIFGDIINPWGALRRERLAAERMADEIADLKDRNVLLDKQLASMTEACDRSQRKALQRQLALQRAEKLIASGHFRNPKTGRLGRRGETFE